MLFGAFIGIVTTLLMGDTWGAMTPWIALLFAAIGSGIICTSSRSSIHYIPCGSSCKWGSD